MKHLYHLILRLLPFVFVVGLLLEPTGALAQDSAPLSPNPAAEQWVLQQVELGEIADLEDQFPNEADRVLGAAFLERLLESPPINITRYGIRIRNAIFIDPLDLEFIQVGYDLQLENCQFGGYVDFSDSWFVGDLSFDGSTFKSRVDFSNIRVDKTFHNSAVSYEDSASFTYAVIGRNFVANDVQFTNAEKEVTFNSMKVGGNVFLRRAVFAGTVNFILANIGVNFDANDVQFTSAEKKADFNSVKVGNSILLTKANFAGAVDFAYAEVGNSFVVDDAHFTNNERAASFNSMRVGKNVFLRRAVFAGSVDFRYTVSRYFDANDAKFLNSKSTPLFDNMIVEGEVWFSGTVFKNGTEFDDATFLDLSLIGDEEDNTVSSISLNRTVIKRELSLKSLQTHDLYIRSLTVHGPAVIRDTNIVNSADFENSEFVDLSIENVVWPDIPESINLRGMQYQNIKITRDREDDAWNELISLINSSKYNAQSYTILESYFLQQGYPERADKVYVAYKRRERAEALNWDSLDWWWSLFLDAFVSYGRSPGRALIWSILIIIFGRFVFGKPENMVLISQRDEVYNPFWYSLDLFIPFVDLGFDKEWAPKPERKWAVAYAKIHMLAGWVLIPIGLLAITGVIK
jgi:hypothetical protein